MRRRKEVITVGDKVIIDKKYFLEKMWNVKKKGNHVKANRVGEVIEITKREPEEAVFTVVMDFGKKFAFSDRSLFRLYEPVVKKKKEKEKPSKSSKQLVENIVVDGGFKEAVSEKEWVERYTEEDIDRVLNMDSYQDTISNVAIAVQENRDGSLLISAGDKNKSQENIREWVTMLYKPKFSDVVREEVKRNISENRQIIKVTNPHEPNGIDKISYNTEEYDVEVHLIRKTDRPTEDFPIENNNAIVEIRPFRLSDYTANVKSCPEIEFNPTNPENVKMWGGLSSGTNLESVTGWGNPMLIWEQNQFRKLNPEDLTALFNKPLSHSVSIPEPVEMKAYTRKDLACNGNTMVGELKKPEIGIVPEYINREKVAKIKSKTMEQVSLGLDIEAAENRIDEINEAIERRLKIEQNQNAVIPAEWIEERNRHIEFVRKTKLLIKI